MQWVRENVGTAAIDIRDGQRVVNHADNVIRVHPGWLTDHGLSEIMQPDRGLMLDTDGEYQYRHKADLGDGFSVYERQ